MNHASLFSGIGGFDLAAWWLGWRNIFQCEKDPYCLKILKSRFPKTVRHDNIEKTNFKEYQGAIDVLSGGFPCQPFSTAGRKKGTADSRYLWPEMLRAVKEIQPRWVVAENVFGIINWSKGVVFQQVHTDLEAAGYQVWAYVLPACGVGAPHRRDRVFFVAHAPEFRRDRQFFEREGIYGELSCREIGAGAPASWFPERYFELHWQGFTTEPGLCGVDDGISGGVDRIKALGNAVVPQVALQLFKAIVRFEEVA